MRVSSLCSRALLCLGLVILAAVSATAQTMEIDNAVQKRIDAKAFPGAAVAVVKDGKVVLAKGQTKAVL